MLGPVVDVVLEGVLLDGLVGICGWLGGTAAGASGCMLAVFWSVSLMQRGLGGALLVCEISVPEFSGWGTGSTPAMALGVVVLSCTVGESCVSCW